MTTLPLRLASRVTLACCLLLTACVGPRTLSPQNRAAIRNVRIEVAPPPEMTYKTQGQTAGSSPMLGLATAIVLSSMYSSKNEFSPEEMDQWVRSHNIKIEEIFADALTQQLQQKHIFNVTKGNADATFQVEIGQYGLSAAGFSTPVGPILSVGVKLLNNQGKVVFHRIIMQIVPESNYRRPPLEYQATPELLRPALQAISQKLSAEIAAKL